MDKQVNLLYTCYNLAGAKIAAKCFRKVAPNSIIKVRRNKVIYVLNRSSIREQLRLLKFAFEVGEELAKKKAFRAMRCAMCPDYPDDCKDLCKVVVVGDKIYTEYPCGQRSFLRYND